MRCIPVKEKISYTLGSLFNPMLQKIKDAWTIVDKPEVAPIFHKGSVIGIIMNAVAGFIGGWGLLFAIAAWEGTLPHIPDGRYDFPGGDGKQLRDSIENLSKLDINNLYPGHESIVEGDGNRHMKMTLKNTEYLM